MKKILVGVGVLIAILLGGYVYTQFEWQQPVVQHTETRTIEVALAIEGVLPEGRAEVPEGMTALDLLRSESREKGFVMGEKEYAGLGILVERIGEFKNGTDGKYWTYTVNGVFAPVGADVYALKDGDAIEWTFVVPDSSSY
ncbi:hypothetical protein A2765_04200 [Candidatus Kaiserbacteria bacterium RIFCSPHIGHO2_01_FULL_56_24]|uniref:Transcobalamin-like C-terminal domain-containing protein n=1 Tax=Candidatus Kaiserbacteria bacterium RIFCSPHIGHO2_01_FULL_56_24 TaxID=1798487 RepID=A0A1F6DFG8_9BACT|nr:MAG: hypothetical protein A2765_04200 [Candidatus Kaiserbacteria bacterium RIFCSPHIGHO2_01_FULL_56_24]